MKSFLSFTIILLLLTFALPLFAQSPTISGLNEAASEANLIDQETAEDVSSGNGTAQQLVQVEIGKIIQRIISIIGMVFFVITLYGGLLWMLAGGDKGKVDKGRKYIVYAVLGLVLIGISYAVTYFVVDLVGSQTMN